MTTYPLKVVKRRQETDDTASLWFDVPADLKTPFAYKTGQFVTIEEDIAGETVARQYSMASVPELDERIQITVKRVPGGRMSPWLVDEVAEGDILEVAAPRGRLYTPADEPRHYVLLAAGSGIVPLYAIARHAVSQRPGSRVTLAYGNRTPDSIILREDVDALTSEGVAVEHVLSRPPEGWSAGVGHVDPAYLADRWENFSLRTDNPDSPGSPLPLSVYMCGPDAFMSAAEEFLTGRGVDLDDIRKESFDLVLNDDDGEPDLLVPEDAPGEPSECEALTAVLGGEEINVTPLEGEPLLTALLRVSEDVPFSCQEGTCASCIVRLTEGQVGVRPGVLQTLRPGDLKEGLILACLSRARTTTVRIDFDEI
jgi:ferredoxin-NADP reductase/ferredoxin